MRLIRLIACFFMFLLVGETSTQSQEEGRVGMLLVLAIDSSASVTPGRWQVQLNGYVQAFKSPEVIEAIRLYGDEGIGVAVFAFGETGQQKVFAEWFRVYDAASALALSAFLSSAERPFKGGTSVAKAVSFGTDFFSIAPFKSERRVLDISGDGKNTDPSPTPVMLSKMRERALAQGITINGLPILGNEADIEEYYQKYVAGGVGSFCITVKNPDDEVEFGRAIIQKMTREIISALPPLTQGRHFILL